MSHLKHHTPLALSPALSISSHGHKPHHSADQGGLHLGSNTYLQ